MTELRFEPRHLCSKTRVLAAKLYFSFDNEKNDQAIYSEMVPGGFINVMRNVEGLESNVLIEPLFNTAVRNRQVIKEIFR